MGKLKVKTEPIPITKRKCDGACGVHNQCIGDIHRFTVSTKDGTYLGTYNYCAKAVATDTEQGYEVNSVIGG